jgi:hypothetical protein
MDISKLKKLGMTLGTLSAIIALVAQVHELWTEKEEEKD